MTKTNIKHIFSYLCSNWLLTQPTWIQKYRMVVSETRLNLWFYRICNKMDAFFFNWPKENRQLYYTELLVKKTAIPLIPFRSRNGCRSRMCAIVRESFLELERPELLIDTHNFRGKESFKKWGNLAGRWLSRQILYFILSDRLLSFLFGRSRVFFLNFRRLPQEN